MFVRRTEISFLLPHAGKWLAFELLIEADVNLVDFNAAVRESSRSRFMEDVAIGLSRNPRSIPCKYFYDHRGSLLFELITEQPEYYPTRAETELLELHASKIAAALGRHVDLVEFGSGSSVKTQILLDALDAPSRYVPIDISAKHLRETARGLSRMYPGLWIEPVVADYSARIEGISTVSNARRVVFFPGSSIGNFEPEEAVRFLRRARELAGKGGVVLVGVDCSRDSTQIERAYNDEAGVTGAFNRNLLHRMQNELDAELDVNAFRHLAVWQSEPCRIEMRLIATRPLRVRLGGGVFKFEKDEYIVTERCYKHDVDAFRALSRRAGLTPGEVWFDAQQRMSMHWLNVGNLPA
jgi:dimethylhistidine N-methyltransferase